MFIKYDLKKDNLREAVTINKRILVSICILNSDYISLVSHFSMTEKEFNFFMKLKTVQERYGYLSRYLLKCCNIVKLSEHIFLDYYNAKKSYNRLLKYFKYKDLDYKQVIEKFGVSLDKIDDYFSIYKDVLEIENSKKNLKQKTTLLIRLVVEKYYQNLTRKNKIHDILNEETNC